MAFFVTGSGFECVARRRRKPPLTVPLALLQEKGYHRVVRVPTAIDLPQGTLHLLILRTIALEPMHGWAISRRIQQVTGDVVQIPQGSLYPALHRLERRGWITASWDVSENNRRARYYRLTASGKKHLEEEIGGWQILADAVARVLKTC